MKPTKPFLVKGEQSFSVTRLIDDQNEFTVDVPVEVAITTASNAGLDLVCIVSEQNEDGPLCKVMDYGKWRYENDKKRKQQKKNHKHEVKEIRFTPTIENHDLSHKIKHAREFIEHGHEVVLSMRIKGRQSRTVAKEKMDSISEQALEFSSITSRKDEHNNIIIRITKQKGA